MSRPSIRPSSAIVALVLLVAGAPMFARGDALPGTAEWTDRGDPAKDMVAGIHKFLDRRIAESAAGRDAAWKDADTSSVESYIKSLQPRRARFQKIVGAVDKRVAAPAMELVATTDTPAVVKQTDRFTIYAVRWPVYDDFQAEGLLIEPKGEIRGDVVAIPDAKSSPEELAGLGPDGQRAVGRRLAESGCRVVIPTLLDRTDRFSGNPAVRMTNLTHREWIYRQAYEVGRHPIGYEVDEVRAAVDWFTRPGQAKRPIGVAGHGEGGLIALYAAAVDPRIGAAWVGGYFSPRESAWSEPIDRNVWSLLTEFGDAEVAGLVAPRPLVVEICRGPEVAGPPAPRNGRADAASGTLPPLKPEAVRAEFARAERIFERLNLKGRLQLVGNDASAPMNADDAGRAAFLRSLGVADSADPEGVHLAYAETGMMHAERQRRIVRGMTEHTQQLVRVSELRRYDYWSKADGSTPAKWEATTPPYRKAFEEELIGKLPSATEPLGARTVKLFDQPKWVGYAVKLPAYPDVPASGILLLPKDMKPGEKRPVVVTQHGLEGRPEDTVDPAIKSVYHAYGAQLADRGYIVYAPQNPYIFHDEFRKLQRKANPLKASLFSVIIRQHERTLEWLRTLPNVDGERIAFYGLSYGGKSAMRIPAALEGYCLSICSADFNEWAVKCTNLERQYSYMYTVEYDMYEFGLAETFNYAEMAGLICPRPFMVERGHLDGVAPDEWVNYEFGKVRRTFDMMGLPERCEIAHFASGHEIDGKATVAFLARHLNWPRGLESP